MKIKMNHFVGNIAK